jgi:Cu/Ag efflux pump CusA
MQRHEGKIFAPMAYSVVSALITSLVLSLTLVTFQAGSVWVIQTNIGSKTHHDSSLSHVRSNHSGSAYDCQLFIRYKFHNSII